MGICASKDAVSDPHDDLRDSYQDPADPTILMWCEQEEFGEALSAQRFNFTI
jgi:hypothetical protein